MLKHVFLYLPVLWHAKAPDLGVYFGTQNGVEIREIPLKLEENCDIVCTYKIMVIFHGF